MLLDLRTKAILVLCILAGFSSCSENDDILDDVSVELSDKEIGRFDNRAFEWDESNYLKSSDCIFIGDKFEVSNANAATYNRKNHLYTIIKPFVHLDLFFNLFKQLLKPV